MAATAGTVTITQDNAAAGPWLISVRSAKDVITWYSHVQNPRVGDGDTVLVGQPLAEVGDLGNVEICALGISIQSVNAKGKRQGARPRRLPHRARCRGPGRADRSSPRPRSGSRPTTSSASTSPRPAAVAPAGATAPAGSPPARPSSRPPASTSWCSTSSSRPRPRSSRTTRSGTLYRAAANNIFRDGNSNGNAIAWKREDWKLIGETEFLVPYKTTLHMPVADAGASRHRRGHPGDRRPQPGLDGEGRQPAGGAQHRPGHRDRRHAGAPGRGPRHPDRDRR